MEPPPAQSKENARAASVLIGSKDEADVSHPSKKVLNEDAPPSASRSPNTTEAGASASNQATKSIRQAAEELSDCDTAAANITRVYRLHDWLTTELFTWKVRALQAESQLIGNSE